MIVCAKGNEEAVELFITHNANVLLKTKKEISALSLSLQNPFDDVTCRLLSVDSLAVEHVGEVLPFKGEFVQSFMTKRLMIHSATFNDNATNSVKWENLTFLTEIDLRNCSLRSIPISFSKFDPRCLKKLG
jgi:hypothetical protein